MTAFLSHSSSTSISAIYEQSIAAVFESCVFQFGDHPAIQDHQTTLTYNQLNSVANRIARELLAHDPGTGKPVGLFFRNKPFFLAALVGVLKTGNIVLPIDPDFPESHNHFTAQDSQASIFLTDNDLIGQAVSLYPDGACLNIQEISPTRSNENVNYLIPPDANAVLLYTSGSTGKPKGVIHSQSSLLHNAARQLELIPLGSADRLSMLYSTSVMGTARDYMNALTTGASLHPFDLRVQGMGSFLEWIAREELTVLHTVPSVFRQLGVSDPRPEQLQSVQLVILGGESVVKSDVDIFKKYFPNGCRLFTGLGSTETGTIRQNILNKTSVVAEGSVPLGFPLKDVEIILQGEDGEPALPGKIGEIVVQSQYLAVGYWQRPELNQAVFLPDPQGTDKRLFHTGDLGRLQPDGCLVHCGRKDFQVKIRGYRIELQEIEAALLSSGLLESAVVVGIEIKKGDYRLVAYIIPRLETADLVGSLRKFLASQLPSYMTPSLFVTLTELPRTPNGKIDRKALPKPTLIPESSFSPDGEISLEKELATLWEEILSVRLTGLDDDFLSLGGDSLHATNLLTEIEKRFCVRLPLAILLEFNTVRKLAALIAGDSTAPNKSLVAVRPQGSKKPLFFIPGGFGDCFYFRNLAKYVQSDRPIYGLQTRSTESDRSFEMGMDYIASAYLAEILELQPEGPYYLAGHSFGGYIAMEVARLLLEQGLQVAFLGLCDTYPPGPRRQASLPNRVLIHLQNLRGLGPRQVFGYFRDRSINGILKLSRLVPVRFFLGHIGFRPKNALVAARISRYNFSPPPYPGNAFLFKVGQRPWYVRWDPMENWQKYIQGKLEIREIPGKHGSMMFEPYVQDLARHLNDCLQLVEAGQQ
jgi:amino acid adenylation domain-containing protein